MGGDMTDDELLDDNAAERAQAAALRDQARAGGLRFEAYLTKDQADWLLEQIERGRFADPSEAVFLTVQNFIEMEPHGDLRDELLRRRIQAAIDDPRPGIPHEEVCAKIEQWIAKPRPESARWQRAAQ
jgi:hypothetical protein